MLSLGDNLTKEEIDDMFDQADVDGDGQLDFGEFCMMLHGNRDENNILIANDPEGMGGDWPEHAGEFDAEGNAIPALHRTASTIHPREAHMSLPEARQTVKAGLTLDQVMMTLERAEKFPDAVDQRTRILNINDFLFMHS